MMPARARQWATGGLLHKAQAVLGKAGIANIQFCDGPSCRRLTMQAQWLRKDGIHLVSGGRAVWLCSHACLTATLIAWLQPSTVPPRDAVVPPRMPFRLALLRAGVLSEEALQSATERSQRGGVPLARLLLDEGAITPEQLAAARGAEAGCAHYKLPPAAVPAAFALPRLLAERFAAATLHVGSGRCVLGFVERIDRRLAMMIETIMGLRVEVCFITEDYRARQLALTAMADVSVDATAAQSVFVGQMPVARAAAVALLARIASQSGAEQLTLAVQSGLLWVRFSGKSKEFFDQVLPIDEQALESGPSCPPKVSSIQWRGAPEGATT